MIVTDVRLTLVAWDGLPATRSLRNRSVKSQCGSFLSVAVQRRASPRIATDVFANSRSMRTAVTDVYVDPNGVMYVTDYNAGLYILQFTG